MARCPSFRVFCERVGTSDSDIEGALRTAARAEYAQSTAENWVEFAQKLAENGRAGTARDRQRLKEILAAKEDAETLAAIDEGIRDADAGRVVPAEKVRELLSKWAKASPKSTHR